MRFGIFFELSVPRPFSADSERQVFENALEQCRVADELGFELAWAVEHHFLEEYSHSSAPEVFLAAASQRTRDIRLGHGIIQTSPLFMTRASPTGQGPRQTEPCPPGPCVFSACVSPEESADMGASVCSRGS